MQVGIIGFGQFGRFMAAELGAYVRVVAYDPAVTGDPRLATLEEVCASDILVFAVPAQKFEEAASAAEPLVGPDTLIADVSSVKVKPLAVLQNHFPNHKILGTHPIFGPQSGKSGIAGLPLVLTNVSWTDEHYEAVKKFLGESLKLKVIERTPEQHDKEMAAVQGLAHFIGRALNRVGIEDYETNTKSYQSLVELKDLLKHDSWDLFETIQNENPYAAPVRAQFLAELHKLQDELEA